MTRLIVRGGEVKGSILELADEDAERSLHSIQGETSIVLASGDTTQETLRDVTMDVDSILIDDDGIQNSNKTSTLFKTIHFRQLIEWKTPSDDHKFSNHGPTTRNLAVNQIGDKTALVFRVTTSRGSPSNSASEVSDGVFGTDGDTVTLKSMYSACSYNLLNIAPAPVPDGLTYSAPGVVDVTVATMGTSYDIENAIIAQYESILNSIDHVLIHVPFGTEKSVGGGTSWVAYADFEGKYGTYNNDYIIDVQSLVHEIGHNYGLDHSGSGNDEYADTTCYMGYTVDDGDRNNAKKCFNAAKMDELGWYTNRVTTIRPYFNEEFTGKVIGVADYGLSDSSHTLSLKILNPIKSSDPFFLTYNRAKGINEDTHTGRNQMRIVRGNAGEQSWLEESADPGESIGIDNYYNGRALQFTFGSAAQDGSVDYVPVTVAQSTLFCNTNDECSSVQSPCNIGTCVGGVCVFELQSSCCGNGLCEPSSGEHCSSCASDCEISTNCNEVDGQDDNSIGGSYDDSVFGIKFNVDVLNDISFYEIEVETRTRSGSVNATIFTYVGRYQDASSDLSTWEMVFNGTSSTADFYIVTMTFNSMKPSIAGSTRAFYIAFETAEAFYFNLPGVEVSNNDATVGLSELVRELTDDIMPGSINFGSTSNFLGGIKYTYGDETINSDESNRPSFVPSKAPSFMPTNNPSSKPSVNPSREPSGQPSALPNQHPTAGPSTEPSKHPYMMPSSQPSAIPSTNPTIVPSAKPSSQPSHEPSRQSSMMPSQHPTGDPSTKPSEHPSKKPSDQPSRKPSTMPVVVPSVKPSTESSMIPSQHPTGDPSAKPSEHPSQKPSDRPSRKPSMIPTVIPSVNPSSQPSHEPSGQPSTLPSQLQVGDPTVKPSAYPTLKPSSQPSAIPSTNPTIVPSEKPSSQPSHEPSRQSSMMPSQHPAGDPSTKPSEHPSMKPSDQPSRKPSTMPVVVPSEKPSLHTSLEPSDQPSTLPSQNQAANPSTKPSERPSLKPSGQPSRQPSTMPTVIPSAKSSSQPSQEPSGQPSTMPSQRPTADPSATPSAYPSQKPSHQPTTIPSLPAPSVQPSTEAPTYCIDDTLFNFTLDIGNIQDCEWLTRNSDPIKVALRITRYCNRGHVKGACQRTCDFCPCQDDSSFVYDFDDEGLRGCDWLLEEGDPLIDASRVDNFCYADEEKTVASEVGDACVLSCGFCSIGNLALPA